MDDDVVIPSPPPSPFLVPPPAPMGSDYSPASPPIDLYEVDARCPTLEMSTPECQAVWEAELAHSPTPPPTADEVIDSVLDAHCLGTPVYQLEVQPLTPPPRWVEHRTPPLPPPDQHLLTNGEIARWSERFFVAEFMAQITDSCFASAFTNPFGECNRIPCTCTHCYLAGLGHCKHMIPAYLGMEYPGDGTPNMQPQGSHQAEQAHLTMTNGDGPGLALQVYVEHHDRLYSECQPHESVAESGGPLDPIDSWVEPTVKEQWTRATLAAPSVPSGYVDM
ncbi:hypothetical protein NDA11_004048 [Ustilago hordei]|uniref:Uncharacterized protein n=1 Tax=Ustilago hordei TaxID=120017 RepID=I2FMN8_USTHO|nr:uncharacterized protein UHO2_01374 [Ustilago hordei]KAJ1044692.1 hypothetical protein NDA10_002345 [Ustilago hordei]KAJ1583585.1 hypothetical protein NDA15_005004 [Ustilago hordei]KAJ1586678.1 hypothetical protein NDA11_004048 [Ustilago hordei]KAJ1591608.1 hypothetical protein NDA12_001541 [Ustilago hordei]CCF48181.1 uncharacterized protein UHOR_12968 [Ustilago hordei]